MKGSTLPLRMEGPIDVQIISREGCHLCDEAKATVEATRRIRKLPIDVTVVDVDTDPRFNIWSDHVPVVLIDGEESFRYNLHAEAFAEAIERRANRKGPEPRRFYTMDEIDLAEKSCVPCAGGVPPLAEAEIRRLASLLPVEWKVIDDHHLERSVNFPDFKSALDFTNRVGAIAEREAHHPDIHLAWGKVRVEIWTHKIDGLTESDFVLAVKIERAIAQSR